MIIAAVDPGQFKSAFVIFDTESTKIIDKGKMVNKDLLTRGISFAAEKIIIEVPKSYGMPIGDSILETCIWIGRFIQAWPLPSELMPRKTVATFLCGTATANDKAIRQALITFYGPKASGGGKVPAIGIKAKKGPLFGVSCDIWAALGVAYTWKIKSDIEMAKMLR